jgi:hypothetical protein
MNLKLILGVEKISGPFPIKASGRVTCIVFIHHNVLIYTRRVRIHNCWGNTYDDIYLRIVLYGKSETIFNEHAIDVYKVIIAIIIIVIIQVVGKTKIYYKLL